MNRLFIARHSIITLVLVVAALFVGIVVGQAMERQPHMRAALNALEKAKFQLSIAEEDKGGHRVKAEQLVNDAIVECKEGIAYANTR